MHGPRPFLESRGGAGVNTKVVNTDEPAGLSVVVSSPLVSPVCTTTVVFYRENFYVAYCYYILALQRFQNGVVYMIIDATNSAVCLIAMSARRHSNNADTVPCQWG